MSRPPPCDREVFRKGRSIMACDTGTAECRAEDFEAWIVSVRRRLPKGSGIDWHYFGGVANVLALGDREAVLDAVGGMMSSCPASVMRWVGEGEIGPHRSGVTPAPQGAMGASYGPDGGEFLLEGSRAPEPGDVVAADDERAGP